MKLEGKVALVTGAASGIGRATAERLARAGARILLADRAGPQVEEVAKRIGGEARAIRLDLADTASIEAGIAEAVAIAGRVDVLVNAAAVYDVEPWFSLTDASFDRIFAINVRGLMMMTQSVAAVMSDAGSGGAIVNVASAGGRRGDPSVVSYAASKAAVISLTQSAARALAPRNIRVNCIAPGPVKTAMYDQVVEYRRVKLGQTADDVDRLLVGAVPLARASEPGEQAEVILFLASDASAYITGQTLNTDGGMFMN